MFEQMYFVCPAYIRSCVLSTFGKEYEPEPEPEWTWVHINESYSYYMPILTDMQDEHWPMYGVMAILVVISHVKGLWDIVHLITMQPGERSGHDSSYCPRLSKNLLSFLTG